MKKSLALSTTLEALVVVMMLIFILYPTICIVSYWFVRDKHILLLGVYESHCFDVFEMMFCIVLALWLMIGDGINSKIWLWLPPFVLFKNMGAYVRAVVVILLIAVSLMGLLSPT